MNTAYEAVAYIAYGTLFYALGGIIYFNVKKYLV